MEPSMGPAVSIEVSGRYALFTDPFLKLSGEKLTYSIPTCESLRGILKSIYVKPTFTWVVEKVRVMNRIRMESKGQLVPSYGSGDKQLAYYTYLADVRYQISARMVWNQYQVELEQDRDPVKHLCIAQRAIQKGGYRQAFLGTSECVADVKPCVFGEGEGAYDNQPQPVRFPMMHHSYTYPEEAYSEETRDKLTAHMSELVMVNGVIEYPMPWDCPVHKEIYKAPMKMYGKKHMDEDMLGVE